MADTQYYGIPLPTNNADFNTWGPKVINLHEVWDAKLASPTNTIKGKNTAGTGPHIDLTPAQVANMLPVVNLTGRGVAPQAAAADALRPLAGNGTFQKSIARVAMGLVATAPTSATLTNGLGIASVTWGGGDGVNTATIAVAFSAPMANTNYHIILSGETDADQTIQSPTVNRTTRTVNGFTLTYARAFHTSVTISVFEAP